MRCANSGGTSCKLAPAGRDLENLGESLGGESDGLDELDKSDGGSVVLRKRASLRGGRHELQARASGEEEGGQSARARNFGKVSR